MKRINIANAGAILADATHFHATSLIRSSQGYMACNMETLLESRYLDDLPFDLIRQLSSFVREKQTSKYPLSRSNALVEKAMNAESEWLALQDIPEPIIPTFKPDSFKDSPKLSPPASNRKLRRKSSSMLSPPASPMIRPQFSVRANLSGPPDDEVFIMDDPDISPTPSIQASQIAPETPSKASGWKTISSAPRYVVQLLCHVARLIRA